VYGLKPKQKHDTDTEASASSIWSKEYILRKNIF